MKRPFKNNVRISEKTIKNSVAPPHARRDTVSDPRHDTIGKFSINVVHS